MADTISAIEFAALIGLSTRRISELAAKGVIPKAPGGRYPHPQAIQAYCAHIRELAAGRGTAENGSQTLAQERAALAREQREGQALKNAMLRGDMIRAEDAERRWTEEMVRLRSRLLAVPTDIALSLPHMTKHDIGAVDRVLRDAMDDASRSDDTDSA